MHITVFDFVLVCRMRSKASNSEELAETQKSLAADEAYLSELNTSCAAKASEWAARQKQAAEEQAAIEKAKEILADGSPSALRPVPHVQVMHQ